MKIIELAAVIAVRIALAASIILAVPVLLVLGVRS